MTLEGKKEQQQQQKTPLPVCTLHSAPPVSGSARLIPVAFQALPPIMILQHKLWAQLCIN